jgi:hypothetical protein
MVTAAKTVIEMPEWWFGWSQTNSTTGKSEEIHLGHSLVGCDGFRIRGFEFHFPSGAGRNVVRLHADRTKSIVLEDCCFRAAIADDRASVLIGDLEKPEEGMGMTAYVRDCVIEGSLSMSAFHTRHPLEPERLSRVVIERNYFVGTERFPLFNAWGASYDYVVVRHNVFTGGAGHDVRLHRLGPDARIEISNNTLSSRNGIGLFATAPLAPAVIRNNVRSHVGFIELVNGAEKAFPQAAQRWAIDHNAYVDTPDTEISARRAPRFSGDLPNMPRFISKVPGDADYLRIAADDPLANAGVGGDWPGYIGALPPGPTPPDGDWFSRLRERWPTK